MKLSGLHGWLVFGWYEHWDVGFICVKFSRACFSHVRQTKPQQGKARTTTEDFPPDGYISKINPSWQLPILSDRSGEVLS